MIKFEDKEYIDILKFCKKKFYGNETEKKYFIKENIKNNDHYFFLLYRICNLSHEIGAKISNDVGVDNNGYDKHKYNKFKIMWIIHEQCVKLSNEILILILNGSASGATIIQRTLFEYSVTAQFIHKHPETSLSYFYNFNRQEKNYIDNLLKHVDVEKDRDYYEYLLKLKNEDEKIVGNIEFKKGAYGWTLDEKINSFYKICEDVEQAQLYDELYRYSSNYTHASIFRVIDNLDMGDGEGRRMLSMQGQDKIFPYTFTFLYNVTAIFLNSYFELKDDSNMEIDVLQSHLKKLKQIFEELLANKGIN